MSSSLVNLLLLIFLSNESLLSNARFAVSSSSGDPKLRVSRYSVGPALNRTLDIQELPTPDKPADHISKDTHEDRKSAEELGQMLGGENATQSAFREHESDNDTEKEATVKTSKSPLDKDEQNGAKVMELGPQLGQNATSVDTDESNGKSVAEDEQDQNRILEPRNTTAKSAPTENDTGSGRSVSSPAAAVLPDTSEQDSNETSNPDQQKKSDKTADDEEEATPADTASTTGSKSILGQQSTPKAVSADQREHIATDEQVSAKWTSSPAGNKELNTTATLKTEPEPGKSSTASAVEGTSDKNDTDDARDKSKVQEPRNTTSKTTIVGDDSGSGLVSKPVGLPGTPKQDSNDTSNAERQQARSTTANHGKKSGSEYVTATGGPTMIRVGQNTSRTVPKDREAPATAEEPQPQLQLQSGKIASPPTEHFYRDHSAPGSEAEPEPGKISSTPTVEDTAGARGAHDKSNGNRGQRRRRTTTANLHIPRKGKTGSGPKMPPPGTGVPYVLPGNRSLVHGNRSKSMEKEPEKKKKKGMSTLMIVIIALSVICFALLIATVVMSVVILKRSRRNKLAAMQKGLGQSGAMGVKGPGFGPKLAPKSAQPGKKVETEAPGTGLPTVKVVPGPNEKPGLVVPETPKEPPTQPPTLDQSPAPVPEKAEQSKDIAPDAKGASAGPKMVPKKVSKSPKKPKGSGSKVVPKTDTKTAAGPAKTLGKVGVAPGKEELGEFSDSESTEGSTIGDESLADEDEKSSTATAKEETKKEAKA